MPTYEYGCEACGANYELEQRITEDPIKKCKKCGKLKAKRLISGGNFMLKGGGWYADGYNGGSNKAAPASAPASAPPGAPAGAPATTPAASPAPAAETKKSTPPSSSD